MNTRRRKPDPFEEMLRQAGKPKREDDLVKNSVRFRGVENLVVEKRRNIEWREDPNNPGMMIPYLSSSVIYNLDDNGRPFGSINNAGSCIYGCIVRKDNLVRCSRCKVSVCLRHSIFVGRRTYCQRRLCSVIGWTHKVLWLLYRFLMFIYQSVTGTRSDDEDSYSEEEFFSSSDNNADKLIEAERE